jgi:hypothetical protein
LLKRRIEDCPAKHDSRIIKFRQRLWKHLIIQAAIARFALAANREHGDRPHDERDRPRSGRISGELIEHR